MGKKYFTLSWDDGLEQDKKIIELMRAYGLKGTFNLNAGKFGEYGEVKGIGGFMFSDEPMGVQHKWPYKYVVHNQIPRDEIVQVYCGMEIASHGYKHLGLARISEAQLSEEVDRDIAELEALTCQKIYGHVYAYGSTNKKVEQYLKKKGIMYARAVFSSNKFLFPDNPLNFKPTCSFMGKNTLKLAEQFKNAESDDDLLFYVWGHGYECNLGTKTGNYKYLEQFFEAIAEDKSITYCTNSEAFMHV